MSKYAGQRRARKRPPVPVLGWVAIAIVLGLTAVTATAVVAGPSDDDESGTSGGTSTAASASLPDRTRCPDFATIGVPRAYAAGWERALAAFGPDASCASVAVMPVPTAAVALGRAPAIDAWIPEDASWIDRASPKIWHRGAPHPRVIARTPVVAAGAAALDRAVGGIQQLLVPPVFGPLVREVTGFADLGADDVGRLRIALPDPGATATGALGFAALTQAATGRPLTGAPAYVDPSPRDLTAIKTEHRISAVGADEAAVLTDLDPDAPGRANLAVTTEQVALAHNAQAPDQPIGVGYLGVDLTMAVVPMHDSAREVVDRLADFFAGPGGIAALTSAGFRPAHGSQAPEAAGAIRPATLAKPGATATSDEVSGLTLLFAAMHQRISTLVVLDASGSMLDPLPGSAASKIDLVRRAARDTLRVASPRARAGLITFRSDGDDQPLIKTAVRLAPIGARSGGRLHSQRMLQAVRRLDVSGGTPLYDAVRTAYRAAVAAYDPDMINQVVVLSDGRNQDAAGSITLSKLLSTLRSAADPDRPVRIIAIGYGPDADMDALTRIVGVTDGRASWLQSVEGYSAAVQEAIFAA